MNDFDWTLLVRPDSPTVTGHLGASARQLTPAHGSARDLGNDTSTLDTPPG